MLPLPSDEASLLPRIAAGDDEAFSTFYREHLDGVVAFFRRRVGDRELAFDLTAETFAAVVVSAGAYNGDAPAVAWLFGIARNKLRESLRRERVADAARRRLGMEPIALDDAALARVEERAGSGESGLQRALEELPEATRASLLGRLVEEQGYGEIAARLQCSEQLVRQRVHRGLKQLRANLREEA
ncbi:MAG TPA: RNA polymerase sigma factor [Solirubrobacteraceae bacterium]|jgi:RNA polymerase sigma-70 factor (ECF subfamily)